MDLSAVIFVVLAVAWAVYLIPKALQHHDELAGERLEEGQSERVRVLRRHRKAAQPEPEAAGLATTPLEEQSAPVTAVARAATADVRPTTRAAARRAARNRRRVLGALLLVLAVVGALAGLAVVPTWAPAVPAALLVAFLVLARISVRRAQGTPSLRADVPATTTSAPAVEQGRDVVGSRSGTVSVEDLVGSPRPEVEAALASEGSLWDPLPMTLPTYVNKARARRTVRTIELTGMTSSGHDEAASAVARTAAASAEPTHEADVETAQRVAGA